MTSRGGARPRSTALAVAVLLVPLLGSCAAARGGGSDTTVVTSVYPLQWLADRVAGGRADVENLTAPGREPHDLELTVRQTAEVIDADVVLYEKGFQPAVDEAVEQKGGGHVVDASGPAAAVGDDPHFWLDPTRLARVAAAFEKELAEVDRAHANAYAGNLRALRRELADLDRDFRAGLADCRIRTVVVSHDAFGYLGRRYGLDVVAINGLSPDSEPSPAHLRRLQDLVRRRHVTTVFSERLASSRLADSLAGDLGLDTAELDPVEGLADDTAQEDYLSLMRGNLAALRKAGRCG